MKIVSIIVILCYFAVTLCSSKSETKEIFVKRQDIFPHKLEKSFEISLYHPTILKYSPHAVIYVEVLCKSKKQMEYLFPGFMSELNSPIKEEFFHIKYFKTIDMNTFIALSFYRNAQNCELNLYYSKNGAQDLKSDSNRSLILSNFIKLYHNPNVSISIISYDGHTKGVTVGKLAKIYCTAKGGFPVRKIQIGVPNLDVKKSEERPTKIIKTFVVRKSDHMKMVKCFSGEAVAKMRIKVFHHADSLEILPKNRNYFQPNDTITCKSVGSSYPMAYVMWNVLNLTKENRKYFLIEQYEEKSLLKLSSVIPVKSHWKLKCSVTNIIPPMTEGGPNKEMNIIIGSEPMTAGWVGYSTFTKVLIIGLVVAIIIIVLVIAIFSLVKKQKMRKKQRQIYEIEMKQECGDVNKPFLMGGDNNKNDVISLPNVSDESNNLHRTTTSGSGLSGRAHIV